ncbi:hypothetical protein C2G38_2171181 [Gigaspora rosea]|uniref:Kelch repeat protein n=1 Tax=Gigaspora rosea TaxID=44941 RepID=A0A397VLX4_9GLOM|nr:hypothetical protein C2G38_2171181 [Gigaspora rosea]
MQFLLTRNYIFYGGWVTYGINRFPNNTCNKPNWSVSFIDEIFNNSIFFIGGYYENISAPINKFDTTTQQWSTRVISGSTPLSDNLRFVPCISLNDGIYIYGGNTSLSAMNKLDTLKLS